MSNYFFPGILFTRQEGDERYLKKSGTEFLAAGTKIIPLDSGGSFKIQDGDIYFRASVDGVYSKVVIYKDPNTQVRHLTLEDES